MTRKRTHFAPPERSTAEEIEARRQALEGARLPLEFFDGVPIPVMVLDEHRQVVMANQALHEHMDSLWLPLSLGLRPGETLGCIHSCEMKAGCGTSRFCQECGACQAILEAQEGQRSLRDCRLICRIQGNLQAMEMRVAASPLDFQGHRYTILSLLDVSHEKRRRALERIFFHDLMNTAGVVSGYASLLLSLDGEDSHEGLERIVGLAHRLVEEIQVQRDLVWAEQGDLEPQTDVVEPQRAIQQVAEDYRASPLAFRIALECVPEASCPKILTDPRLLGRILSNMVKNALEATPEGGVVRLGAREEAPGVQFWVHNAGVIPEEQQVQIFQRSFSTKAANRGLGTYSVKLLAENYLGGRAWFESTEAGGTTFRVWLPALIPERPSPEQPSPGP